MTKGDKVLEVADANVEKYTKAGWASKAAFSKNTVKAQPTVVKAEEPVEAEVVVSDNDDTKGD